MTWLHNITECAELTVERERESIESNGGNVEEDDQPYIVQSTLHGIEDE